MTYAGAANAEKPNNADTINFSVDPGVRSYLSSAAKAQGLDLSHLMQKVVEAYVIETGPKEMELVHRLAAKRTVIDMAQKNALDLDASGGFDAHFILNVIKASATDPVFVEAYDGATRPKDDSKQSEARSRRIRIALNQQLGRVIKRTVGAKSMRNENGAIARASATDALIGTYTLLTKPT